MRNLSPEFLHKAGVIAFTAAETISQLLHPSSVLAENITLRDRTIELPAEAHKFIISKVLKDGLEYRTTMIRHRGLMAVVNEEEGEIIYVEKPHPIVPSEGAFDFLTDSQ